MKVFLSYPSAVHPIVENIYRHLPGGAFETWLDTERIRAGDLISDELIQNIRDSEYFVSFINNEAIESGWVRQELEEALAREKAIGRSFILPVLLNEFPKERLPDSLRERRFLTYNGTNYPRQVATFANELADELLRLSCQKPPLRCEGMAAVYFFSFVEPFLKTVYSATNLRLKWKTGETRLDKLQRVELRVLLPEILDEFNLTELLKRPNLERGALLDGDETVFRQILFGKGIEEQSGADVIFYDVPNILTSAAKLFAQERSNRDWKKQNRMELLAFKYNVERLADKNITKDKMRATLKVEVLG